MHGCRADIEFAHKLSTPGGEKSHFLVKKAGAKEKKTCSALKNGLSTELPVQGK